MQIQSWKLRLDEKIEIALIAFVVAACGWWRHNFPVCRTLGDVLVLLASLFLLQSLLRDVWLWLRLRFTASDAQSHPVERQCMCVESLLGLSAVMVGLLLMIAGGGRFLTMHVPATGWPIIFGVVLICGFLLKDLVLDWSQKRILRERDHSNLLPRWRPKKQT